MIGDILFYSFIGIGVLVTVWGWSVPVRTLSVLWLIGFALHAYFI